MLASSSILARRLGVNASVTAVRSLSSSSATSAASPSLSSEVLMAMEYEHGAHNYHPIPVVFSRAQGANVWDPEGKHYYDFLSAYSAVNQGHCHPKIVKALVEQASQCTLSSRAFYNDKLPQFAKRVTEMFGYDMVLPMNTGAEAVETGLKIARKWGHMKKGIKEGRGAVVSAKGCFHGRTLAAVSLSDDPECRKGFGPFVPNIHHVAYNDVEALERIFEKHHEDISCFIVEPIQGEGGVIVPQKDYLSKCHALCKKYNILLIADEIQTGLCRTGRVLAQEWDGARADITLLGKALSGGTYPVSCALADREVMTCIHPGEHGSTYGGNPIAAAVGIASLEVLVEERLAERADELGQKLRSDLTGLNIPFVKEVRGRGLLNAIEIDPSYKHSGR